jgi:hypothetical protein
MGFFRRQPEPSAPSINHERTELRHATCGTCQRPISAWFLRADPGSADAHWYLRHDPPDTSHRHAPAVGGA